MPIPANLQPWKQLCTWTSPAADGAATVSYTFRCMAISSADCDTKCRAAYQDFNTIGSGVTFGTPVQGT